MIFLKVEQYGWQFAWPYKYRELAAGFFILVLPVCVLTNQKKNET